MQIPFQLQFILHCTICANLLAAVHLALYNLCISLALSFADLLPDVHRALRFVLLAVTDLALPMCILCRSSASCSFCIALLCSNLLGSSFCIVLCADLLPEVHIPDQPNISCCRSFFIVLCADRLPGVHIPGQPNTSCCSSSCIILCADLLPEVHLLDQPGSHQHSA